MFDRLSALAEELTQLETRLPDLYASGDQKTARDAGRRVSELRPIVEAYQAYATCQHALDDAQQMAESETDSEMRTYLREEVDAQRARLAELDAELRELLIPRDPNDGKNVIVEIRGAEGGEEANIWAGDLFRMYQRFGEQHKWRMEILNSQPSDMGGFKEVTFVVKGADAWARLKYEAGPHRVQRVPATESQGRVHTSAATVAVLPEAEEIDVQIDPNDLEVDVFRSSGPGGQSVNTTDSAVRLTHKPTGIVVSCQDEKSQLQNKDKALRILRARLLQAAEEAREAEMSSARKSQLKSGGRSEKIRTYNYKDNRVTDHRIGLTIYSLDQILEGQLDDIVDGLTAFERAEQLAAE
ncbi:MAG: peptide chain release factor 1 [Acidimicrobiia bacterium]